MEQPYKEGCGFGPLFNFVGRWQPMPRGAYPPVKWGPATPVERFPAWCPRQQWFTEQVPWGKRLVPQDLFTAMRILRQQTQGG